MKMDNSDFKRKAAETTGIFGKLRDSLGRFSGVDLGNTTKELNNISRAAGNVNLDKLGTSLDYISSKFSALNVMATTALVNITNRAVNAGLALQKSLTVDQLSAGFREYETKIGAINTMLFNTKWQGTNLDDVKETLGQLNEYADKTIYSFSEMTRSIGRFTTAGIGLEESAIAIKGLGNLAALSGSTSEQYNRALYQASQALQGDYFQFIDWTSIEEAGMGGKHTKDALMDTAEAMGIAIDRSKTFKDSLADGWLTTEVFIETMRKFGEDESMVEAATKVRTFTQMMETLKEGIGSGWAETWELIFGDFYEATTLFTGLSKIIQKPFDDAADARNNFLRALIDGGGSIQLFQGIQNGVKPLIQIFGAIGDGFRSAFPPAGIDRINSLVSTFNEFTKGLKLSGTTVDNLTTIFHGLFAIFSSVWEIAKALTQAVFGLLPSFKEIGAVVVAFLAGVARLSIGLNEAIKSGSIFTTVIDFIGASIDQVGKGLEWFANLIKPLGSLIGVTFGGNEISETNQQLTSMSNILQPVTNFFKGLFNSVVTGFNWVKTKLVEFGQAIKNALPEGNSLVAGGFIAGLIAVVANAIVMGHKLFEVFTGWGGIGNGLTEVLESVSGALNAFSVSVYANALLKVGIALAILAGSLYLIQDLGYKEIAQGLYALIGGLSGLVGAIAIISKYNLVTQTATIMGIIALSVAMTIMAGALNKLSTLNFGDITKGVYGLIGIMGALTGAVALMSKFGGGAIGASSFQILAIAASIHIIAGAIDKIAEIDTGKLIKGTIAMGVIMTQVAIFMRSVSGTKFGIFATLGMLAIGQAIKNITDAINDIAGIDTNKITKGLLSIGIILGQIIAFARLTSDMGLLAAGAGMLLISGALMALTVPITQLGNTDLKILATGIGAIAVALLAIGAASMMMTGMITAGIGLGLIAGSLLLLTVPIKIFAGMSWEGMLKGLLGLVGGIAALGLASMALAPTIPLLLSFGAGLTLLGVGMLAAGAGMSLFGAGLLALSTLSVGAVTTIVATIATLIAGFASLIPTAVDFMWNIMVKMAESLEKHAPKLIDAIIGFVAKLIQTFADKTPEFMKAGTDLIVNFIDGIANAYPRIMYSAVNLIVTYIEGMAEAIQTNGPRMTDAILQLWGSVILIMVDAGVQMVNAIFGWMPGVKEATTAIASSAENYIYENFRSGLIGEGKGIDFAKGLSSKSGDVEKAGKSLATSGKDGADSVKMNTSGENFGEGFALGIGGTVGLVAKAANRLAEAAMNKIRDVLDINSPARETFELGGYTGQGFADGIKNKSGESADSAKSIAGVVMGWLGVKSHTPEEASKGGKKAAEEFSKGIDSSKPKVEESGAETVKSLTKGIESKKPQVKKSAEDIAKEAREAFKDKMDDAKYRFQMEEIDAQQYADKIKKIKDEYSSYADLVKEANLEIKKAEEDAAKHREELRKKEFEHSKSWIDNRKYYNNISLVEELQSWKRVMERYKEGTEERKEAEREVYRLKNDINKKLIAINDEYTSKVSDANKRLIDGVKELNDEYEKAVSDRTNALTSFVGIFDEIKEASDVSGTQLMDNLKGQVNTFIHWSSSIEQLAKKGIDEGLLEELRKMGPKAANEIGALNSLTEEQLSEYSSLWRVKNALARDEAVSELEGLKQDTDAKIKELRDQTSVELETYKTEWLDKIREIRTGTTDEFVGLDTSLMDIGKKSIKGLMNGLKEMKGPLMTEAKRIAKNVSDTIRDALNVGPKKENVNESLTKFFDNFEPPTLDNEIHFKAVVDYDKLDPKGFGVMKGIKAIPDTSFTKGMVAVTKSNLRQNDNKTSTSTSDKTNVEGSKQPIIIQSVLNGRVIAEETFKDTSQLLNNQTNLDYSMKGV